MYIQNSVKRGRGRGLVALVGAVIAAPACFLPVPPVDEDPSTSSASSSGGASTGEVPTTGGESTSTGEATSTGVAETSTSSSTSEAGESSTGTTEFSLPTCPYDPPGAVVTLAAGAEGDMSLQACGTNKQFTRLKLMQSTGTALPFAACSDDACSECADDMAVDLDVAVPDPFSIFGAGVVEGGCYALDMKWERPTEGDPAVCQPSTVMLRRFVDGEPLVVPSLLYRLASELGVVDEVGEFSLTAAPASLGTIHCPCDGDCCEEPPGTRDVQFTIAVGGQQFMGEPLGAEQAQDLALDDEEVEFAGISLVRSHVPSECAALPVHEWVFRHPVTH